MQRERSEEHRGPWRRRSVLRDWPAPEPPISSAGGAAPQTRPPTRFLVIRERNPQIPACIGTGTFQMVCGRKMKGTQIQVTPQKDVLLTVQVVRKPLACPVIKDAF